MKFKIGQKVMIVNGSPTAIHGVGNVGLQGVIRAVHGECDCPFHHGPALKYLVDWADGDTKNAHEHNLKAIDDGEDYKLFMERVLKPVPELQGLPLELA